MTHIRHTPELIAALQSISENLTVGADVRVRVENMHDTQIRHDLRLLALEENQKDAKDFRAHVRQKLEEMTAINVKMAFIMFAASLVASGVVGLIVKKF